MLSVQHIHQYYGGSHILRDVSLTAQAGQITVLLGRNGVGKTTSVSYTHLTLPTILLV